MYGPEGIDLDCFADDQGKVLCYSEYYGYVDGSWEERQDEETGEGYVMVNVMHAVEEGYAFVDCKFTSEEHSECTWGRSWVDEEGNW